MFGNTLEIFGNLVADPTVTLVKDGTLPMAKFSVARSYPTQSGEQKAEFFDCTLFGEMANHVAVSLHKGDRVAVIGRLQQSKWTQTKDAQGNALAEPIRRSKVEILVDEVLPSLRWATAVITKIPKPDTAEAPVEGLLETAEAPY